jgi:glycine oxidase
MANSKIVPGIERFQFSRVWKSWRPCTDDQQPIIGSVLNKRVHIAAGFYGLGITLAPATACLVAQVLVTGSPQAIPPELMPGRLINEHDV